MKLSQLISSLVFLASLGFLSSCGDGPKPADTNVEAKPEPQSSQAPAPEKKDSKTSVQTEPEEALELDPEVEEKIDRFLAGDGDTQKGIEELVQDPQFMALFESLDPPSEATAMRMQSAMQLLMQTQGIDPGILEEDGGPIPGQKISIGSDNPEVLRAVIRAALNGDSEKFYGTFADAIEESAVTNAIDPEAEAPVKVFG